MDSCHSNKLARSGVCGALEAVAMALLVGCLATRPFLGELEHQTSRAPEALAMLADRAPPQPPQIERWGVARALMATALLAALALWAVSAALAPRHVPFKWLCALVLGFAAWSALSAANADDAHAAWRAWLDQAGLLAGLLAAAQLLGSRRRFGTLVVVLVGLAGALGAKAVYQRTVEIPQRVEEFERDPAAQLRQVGAESGSAKARLFEARVRDTGVSGYLPLANPFASLMLPLAMAAGGLAAGAWRARQRFGQGLAAGEVNPAYVAAAACGLIALAGAVAVVLTRSAGGAVSLTAAVAALAAVLKWRRWLAARWRLAAAVVLVTVASGAAAVALYGLKADELPTRTMTFRWYYWTASAQTIAQNPWLGAGPGNFADAYLLHRRAAAEESVKDPHNFVVHAMAVYGLPGGLAFVAIVLCGLVAACRPRDAQAPSQERPGGALRGWHIAALAGAVLAARGLLGGAFGGAATAATEAFVPAAAFAATLALALWCARRACNEMDNPRVALVCGLAAVAIHETVNFALWVPAAATVFWVSLGGCMARSARRPTAPSRGDRAAAVAAAIAVCAALASAGTMLRTALSAEARAERMLHAAWRHDAPAAASAAAEIAALTGAPSDWLDAAQLRLARCSGPDRTECLQSAQELATGAAWAASWQSSQALRLLAQIEWELAGGRLSARREAAERMRQASRLDPMNMRLRIELAQMLVAMDLRAEASAELEAVLRIDAALLGRSVEKLTPDERELVTRLRQ
jgi:O-antigen ligase